MDKLSVGHPIFEFASMYATYYGFSCVNKQNTDRFLGIPLEVSNKIFDKTFEYYYSDKSYEELEDIKFKLSIISYIQVLHLRMKYVDDTCNTQNEDIEFCVNYLSNNAQKLDTLSY